MKIETISGEVLSVSKWPIAKLLPPWQDEANPNFMHYDSLVVAASERQACAQAFYRYKRAHPTFDYRSRSEGENHRFWRIA